MDTAAQNQPPTPAPIAAPVQQNYLNPSDIENDVREVAPSSVEAGVGERAVQIGETGTLISQGMLSGVDYNPQLTGINRILEYDKMRLGDATVKEALSAVKLPLKAANWFIKAPKDSDDEDEKVVFIRKQLLENDNFSWTELLGKILTFCDYGNAIFEKVYYPTKEGKIGFKRFGHRLSKTIHRWSFEDGKTPGITQFLPASASGKTIREIPKWKLMYFINELEGSNYEGISLLRAAHKHWYFKDLYYKIDVMAMEKHGLGVPQIQHPPNAQPADIRKAQEVAKNMRANEQSFQDLPPGFSISMLDMKTATLKDPKEMIAHHNREIVVAFLADFLDLGADGAGSYALSSDKTDFFKMSLENLAKIIQEQFNKAIKELIILNWGEQEEYPKLEYSGIGQRDMQKMAEALSKLGSAGFIHADEATEKQLREELNMPEAEEGAWDFEKEMEERMLSVYDQDPNQPQNDPKKGKNGTGKDDVDDEGKQKAVPSGKPVVNKGKPFIRASEDFLREVIELREGVQRAINAKETT